MLQPSAKVSAGIRVSPIATSSCVIIVSETTQNGSKFQVRGQPFGAALASIHMVRHGKVELAHMYMGTVSSSTPRLILHENQARCITTDRAISCMQCPQQGVIFLTIS